MDSMTNVYRAIDTLLVYAQKYLGLEKRNLDYTRNAIFNLLDLDGYDEQAFKDVSCGEVETPEKLVKDFADACISAGLIDESNAGKVCDAVMGAVSLSPKQVEDKFYSIMNKDGGAKATEWFYDYSVKSDYVKKALLDRNPRFEENGLIITINKAKPEFRDSKKAAEGNKPKGGYPKCNICHSNENFSGRSKCTLRTINLTLDGQDWFWQFSPYGYFYQHGIVVNYEHTPMHIDRGTFSRLMDFCDKFPRYFIGSNAALPRIGGSVLAHDHYQGGGEILPLQKAKAYKTFSTLNGSATIEILDWPGTVLRVITSERNEMVDICDAINESWKNYVNQDLGLIPFDNDGRHHAISPTVIKTERGYEMNIILRSNIVSEKYPDGVFHAHPEFHIIKKESIGLIEAQGLFILPGRLDKELAELGNVIVSEKELPNEMKDFQLVYDEIKALCKGNYSKENVTNCVKKELGSICYRILENTAVFKDRNDFERFLKSSKII